MPNWCHNTLTVTGEASELARFVLHAQPSEEVVRELWRDGKRSQHDPEKRTFKVFLAAWRENNPLSFESIVPEDHEWIKAHDASAAVPCDMCGGVGTLPDSEDAAVLQGAKWYDWMDPETGHRSDDRSCNVCRGDGTHVPFGEEGWWKWRHENWGCKWDASFSGPLMAIGNTGMDVETCVDAQGSTITPTVAVYKFDTPWGQPSPFVERASELYPELEFTLRYGEPGNGYAGEERYVAGVCVEMEELEVEEVLAPEEMWF